MSSPVIELGDLKKYFKDVKAVDGVTVAINEGEIFGGVPGAGGPAPDQTDSNHLPGGGDVFEAQCFFVRDGFWCAYCGSHRDRLSVDHIIPRSRGGRTSFENCVAACKSCNLKKGGQTPSEAGMYLRTKAYQPTISEFLRMKFQQRGFQELLSEIGF